LALVVITGFFQGTAVAQCFIPSAPRGLTWNIRDAGLQLAWASTGLGDVTRWTVLLTPPSGPALTFVIDAPPSWTMVTVPPGVYRFTVIGSNDCGHGSASEPIMIDTTAPAPPPGIVLQEIGPFIELRNAGPTTVDVGGWRLYGSSGLAQLVTEGPRLDDFTRIPPGCTLLLGDTPLESGVPRDFAIPAQFGFSTSLALARGDGRIIDQVGRAPDGEAIVTPPFGEGTPLLPYRIAPVTDTRSYSRSGPDTGDNRADFALSAPSAQNSGSCQGIPVAPFNLAASVQGASVILTWEWANGGIGVDAFQIEAGSIPGAADRAVGRVSASLRSVRIDGVPPATYYVRLRSVYGPLLSAASNEIAVTVCAVSPCEPSPGAPLNVRWTVTGRDVRVQWDPPVTGGTPTSYVLEAGSAPGTADLGSFDTGSTLQTLIVSAVPPGRYFARIRARNASGIGPPSHEIVVNVP
jgi:hypothetical protein